MALSAPLLCEALAGQRPGLAGGVWLWLQVICWSYMAAVAAVSAVKWATHWGDFHTELGTLIGGGKTLGFMVMDLLAACVLRNARLVRRQREREAPGTVDEAKSFSKLSTSRARNLICAGLVLGLVQATYWAFFLWDLRPRWKTCPVYISSTATAGAMLVLLSPGLVCAVFPALLGRERAGSICEELLGKIRAADSQGGCDWDEVLRHYGKVDNEVSKLSANFSPMVRAWLWTMGLGAAAHGVSMWLWIDKLSVAPPHAVYITHVLAFVYGSIFLAVYFMFSGLIEFRGQLESLARTRLGTCESSSEVAGLTRALHYFQTQIICWTVELWPGSTVEVSQLRGQVLSAAFLGNLGAKLLPRLVGLWCRMGNCACEEGHKKSRWWARPRGGILAAPARALGLPPAVSGQHRDGRVEPASGGACGRVPAAVDALPGVVLVVVVLRVLRLSAHRIGAKLRRARH